MQQLHQNTDTSSQAMTEVALGLSMAFFSLLVLALLSVSAGRSIQQSEITHQDDSLLQQERLSISQSKQASGDEMHGEKSESAQESLSFVFYHEGRYYNEQLENISIDSLDPSMPIVVALDPSLSFSEVMRVHSDMTGKQVQVTEINADWSAAISQRVGE